MVKVVQRNPKFNVLDIPNSMVTHTTVYNQAEASNIYQQSSHKVGDGMGNKKEEESRQRVWVWDEMMSRQSTTDLFGTVQHSNKLM